MQVVSSSQLGSMHSKLKTQLDRMVSTSVGLRILDIFILKVYAEAHGVDASYSYSCLTLHTVTYYKHNLNVGAKFDRNPTFSSNDFLALTRAAVFYRGTLPDSSQLEFMYALLKKNASASYRTAASDDSIHQPWELLLEMMKLGTRQVSAHLLQ